MKFYLAGPVGYGNPGIEWKQEIKSYLRSKGHEVYDPIENDSEHALVKEMNKLKENPRKNFIQIKEIMQEIFIDDCEFITNCDYIVCYFINKAYGTISEQGIAYYLNIFLGKKVKTISIFSDLFNPDEWLVCCSNHIFFGLDECLKFLKEEIK